MDDKEISEISFQMTFLYGEAEIVASRSIERPNLNMFDKIGIFSVNLVNFKKEHEGNLKGNYYIGVYSIAECAFTMNTFLIKNKSNRMNPFINLENGIP